MAQDQTKKEALFNEVKGSLFEYLMARKLALKSGHELTFLKSLDSNYLNVLSQQDRMVRQFYPEMLPFLEEVSTVTVNELVSYLKGVPTNLKLTGKFTNSSIQHELNEADLLLTLDEEIIPVSLKLNKKNAFVNTKSGGIKSFFKNYFNYLPTQEQAQFNQLVDLEFVRMAVELHALHDLEHDGSFKNWIEADLSELPGELEETDRQVLKSYYARIAKEMHRILGVALRLNPQYFGESLAPLIGFGHSRILQVICFHDFKMGNNPDVKIHSFDEIKNLLSLARILEFNETSSVEIQIGNWSLQIRVKPMNKFTTTAIKINCSVKVMPPSDV